MRFMKKTFYSLLSALIVLTMSISQVNAGTVLSSFVQNTGTANTYGFADAATDAFVCYSDVAGTPGSYTSLASKIYKPVSGDTLIVVFHGNGEGGVDGASNNYTQLAANRLAATFVEDDIQAAFHGAYVLAFQAPDYWYNDYTNQAKAIIDQAKVEFGIDQVFIAGLSAGGLMSQRMLASYGDYFSGALISCAAIAKNNQYVEGLGGDYSTTTEYLDAGDPYTTGTTFKKPLDYATYMANYDSWLEAIAQSDVGIFLVHGYYDTTIYYQWTQYAYDSIKDYRDSHDLDGDIHYGLIDDVSYPDETFGSQHWSWIKMLNGDVYASTNPSLDTISWFTSLAESTNSYQKDEMVNPTAGASGAVDTYAYNLIGEVTNSGEKIVAIEIDMDGKNVDASKLSTDMFTITGYNYDATGLVTASVSSYGIFATEAAPMTIEVASVDLNDAGNIVLTLTTRNGVLNYTTLGRNLPTNVRYSIASSSLPFVDEAKQNLEEKSATDAKAENLTITSDNDYVIETGDQANIMMFALLAVGALGVLVYLKKEHN